MVKRIGSTAWRVEVAADGRVFSLAVRSDAGREYEVLLGTCQFDADRHGSAVRSGACPSVAAAADFRRRGGPEPSEKRAAPSARDTGRGVDGNAPVLVLDFGGTVLKVAIDPEELRQRLAEATSPAGRE